MIGIFIMFIILFRNIKLSLIGVVPNFIAAFFILGIIGLIGIPLDMMTITIAAITIGIAVDNSIHYIYRFKEEFSKIKDYNKTLKKCHSTVGVAILNTSITIVFGFSILVLSKFIPTIYFGLFTGLAMLLAMISVLTLLPTLILTVITCYKKGFVLSILSMAKWLLAYVITLILFPRIKPYFKNIIDNEYVLDVGLGIIIFVVVIFLVLVVNKGISKAVSYTGIGGLDTTFGFFFGFIRAYIIAVCIFSGFHIVYNHDKWPINKDRSYVFPYLEKGSNYLIKEFPNEKTYQDSKEKIEEL